MRPIWKGHISFGLVNVPVALYPAEQRADLNLHMLDSRNFKRVRYERVNAETGDEVPWNAIVKGYDFDDGNYVVVGPEEMKKAAPEATKTIEIEAFVDLKEIDFMYFDRPYYLEPGRSGEKGYALLRDVLRETDRVGIARVVIRTRQYIAAMVPVGDALSLNLLRYQQELRGTEELNLPGTADEVGVNKRELKMARDLVESMSAPWDPGAFHDEYREQLMAWIESKIESGDIHHIEDLADDEEDAPAPINMMEALKRSLEQSGQPEATARKKTKKPPKSAAKSPRKKAV